MHSFPFVSLIKIYLCFSCATWHTDDLNKDVLDCFKCGALAPSKTYNPPLWVTKLFVVFTTPIVSLILSNVFGNLKLIGVKNIEFSKKVISTLYLNIVNFSHCYCRKVPESYSKISFEFTNLAILSQPYGNEAVDSHSMNWLSLIYLNAKSWNTSKAKTLKNSLKSYEFNDSIKMLVSAIMGLELAKVKISEFTDLTNLRYHERLREKISNCSYLSDIDANADHHERLGDKILNSFYPSDTNANTDQHERLRGKILNCSYLGDINAYADQHERLRDKILNCSSLSDTDVDIHYHERLCDKILNSSCHWVETEAEHHGCLCYKVNSCLDIDKYVIHENSITDSYYPSMINLCFYQLYCAWVLIMKLILSGDIETNPGPKD